MHLIVYFRTHQPKPHNPEQRVSSTNCRSVTPYDALQALQRVKIWRSKSHQSANHRERCKMPSPLSPAFSTFEKKTIFGKKSFVVKKKTHLRTLSLIQTQGLWRCSHPFRSPRTWNAMGNIMKTRHFLAFPEFKRGAMLILFFFVFYYFFAFDFSSVFLVFF